LLLVAFVLAIVAALVGGCGGGSTPVVVYDPVFLTESSTPTPSSTALGVVIFADGQHSVELRAVDGAKDEFVSRFVPTGGIERNPIPVQSEPVKAFTAFYDPTTKLYVIASIEGNKAYLYRLKAKNAYGLEEIVASAAAYGYIAVYGRAGKFYAGLSKTGEKVDLEIEVPAFVMD